MISPLNDSLAVAIKALGGALSTASTASGISKYAIDDCGNGRIPLPKPPKFDPAVASKVLQAARLAATALRAS